MSLNKPITTFFLCLFFLLPGMVAHGQTTPTKSPLTTPVEAFRLDDSTVVVTVTLLMETDWYTYTDIPGGMGKPTRLSGVNGQGDPIAPAYPAGIPKKDAFDPNVTMNTYKSGTRIFATVPVGTTTFPLTLRLDMLLCHPTKCVPVRRDLQFGTPALDPASLPKAQDQPWWTTFASLTTTTSEQQAQETPEAIVEWHFTPTYLQPGLEVQNLLSAILMGLLAGLILNIMPCVLPVVSLKMTALLNSSSIEREADRIHAFREHNIYFALGAMTFFLFLALVLSLTGRAWGALFQNQWLVVGVAVVIFALSLSLFGLFHLPVIDLKFGTESRNPRVQAFFTGNLTTLLATPCSGPFLGGVLSWALVQGPLITAVVFISIGLGMASPYLLLAARPGLSRYLPRSGPWIEYVEKGIAFFLVGTAVYLLSIAFGSALLRILAPLWALALTAWLWLRTQRAKTLARWLTRTASLGLVVLLVALTTPAPRHASPWEPFDPVSLHERIGQERLLVDFTADWCPTCQALEATVLTEANVHRWKYKYGISFIKVDMTENDPESEALLRALGSASIPTAALFKPGETANSPLVLRDLFTKKQLEKVFESWDE